MKKNIFGQTILLKKLIIGIVGSITHRTFRNNRFEIKGSKNLIDLPETNVLFVSNHQTYFYDVIAMLHVFNSSVKGRIDSVKKPKYLINPKTNLYYIASLDPDKIKLALKDGWVITFPRGTTDNSKPIRKGTAHIIKSNNPLVVPIKISGFKSVFQRNGLRVINTKKSFSIEIMKPLRKDINKNSIDNITIQLEKIID